MLLPAVLAMALHGLLLVTDASWLRHKKSSWSRPKALTLTLDYLQPPKRIAEPEKKPNDVQKKILSFPIEKEKKKPPLSPPKPIKEDSKIGPKKPEKKQPRIRFKLH